VLADSYIHTSSLSAGGAAEAAASRKEAKYAGLARSHLFFPLAFETLGAVNSQGLMFLCELGRRISSVTGDVRETEHLFQRLALTVQRFNAIVFREAFICSANSAS
jgi:hypothetical protein